MRERLLWLCLAANLIYGGGRCIKRLTERHTWCRTDAEVAAYLQARTGRYSGLDYSDVEHVRRQTQGQPILLTVGKPRWSRYSALLLQYYLLPQPIYLRPRPDVRFEVRLSRGRLEAVRAWP